MKFPRIRQLKAEPELRPRAALALSSMAAALSEIRNWRLETKEELRQAVLLLDLLNHQARLLIDQLGDTRTREQLVAHSSVIEQMLEIARHKISQI